MNPPAVTGGFILELRHPASGDWQIALYPGDRKCQSVPIVLLQTLDVQHFFASRRV